MRAAIRVRAGGDRCVLRYYETRFVTRLVITGSINLPAVEVSGFALHFTIVPLPDGPKYIFNLGITIRRNKMSWGFFASRSRWSAEKFTADGISDTRANIR